MSISTKSIITASLVLPLLLVACDRTDKSPTTGSSQEKSATQPSTSPADPPMGKSPPSPADVSSNPAAPSSSAPSTAETPPAERKSEPK